MEKQMPLNEYCNWLEKLTESGDTISARGLQKWIERYASENLETKLKNHGDIGDVRNLLLDFADYSENDKTSEATDECVDNYLDQKQ
jgi:hypothetical protein